jgi:hypothetical protein
MLTKLKLTKNYYWSLPLLIALVSRYVFFIHFINSPFKFYHMVRGLDMYSIFVQFPTSSVTIYYLFLRAVNFFFGSAAFVENVVLIQLILGIIACGFIVYIAKKLTEDRRIACCAGLAYALYAPVLMYEGVILKESFYLFFAIFILFVCFYIIANKFSDLSMLLLGTVILIPGFVRNVGVALALIILCWFLYFLIKYTLKTKFNCKKKIIFFIRKVLIFFIGLIIMMTAVFISSNNHIPIVLSVFSNFKYFAQVGQQKNLISINEYENTTVKLTKQDLRSVSGENDNQEIITKYFNENSIQSIKNYVRNFLFTFRAYEIPNNLNYYFIRNVVLPLKYMLGPLLLFPVGIAGFAMLLLYWRKLKNPELVFLFSIPSIVACIIFLPLARYRIVITPVLIISASFFLIKLVDYIILGKYLKFIIYGIILILVSFIQLYSLEDSYLRASDFVVYGQAARHENPASPVTLYCFKEAYNIRPDLNYTKNNLIQEYLRIGDFKNAETLLKSEYKKNPGNFDVVMNYTASLMGTKQYTKVYEVLSRLSIPKDKFNLKNYYFNWGEYYFFTGNHVKAIDSYKKTLNMIEPGNKLLRDYIYRRINFVKG